MGFGYIFNFEVTLTSEHNLGKCREILLSSYNDFRFCVVKSSHKNTMMVHSMFGGGSLTELLIYLENLVDKNLIFRELLFTYIHVTGDTSKSGIVLFSETMAIPLVISIPSLLNSDIPKIISERFQSQTLVEFFQKGNQS